ncbi:MAG: DMT family transporter [Pseudomonadota bacterium]
MKPLFGRARLAGVLAAIASVTIWAGWIPVTRLGVVTHLDPIDVAALRYGTCGLILLPFLWRQRAQIPFHRCGLLLLIAAGAGIPYFLLFGMGLRLANSGQAAVFGPGASSLFTILIAAFWLRESLSRARVIGILCTLVGFALVASHELLHGGVRLRGFGLILLASLAWSLFAVASRRLALAPLLTAAFIGVTNAAVFLPFYLFSHGPARLAAAPLGAVLLQSFYQGILTGTIAMMTFTFAIGRLGASGAAAFTPLAPVLAGCIGWWLLGDALNVATALGLAAVAIGVVFGSGALGWVSARR